MTADVEQFIRVQEAISTYILKLTAFQNALFIMAEITLTYCTWVWIAPLTACLPLELGLCDTSPMSRWLRIWHLTTQAIRISISSIKIQSSIAPHKLISAA